MQHSTRGAFPTPPSDSLVCFNHANLFPCRRCLVEWKREERAFRINVVTVVVGMAVFVGGVVAVIGWVARL